MFEQENRYYGVKSGAVADYLDSRVAFPPSQRAMVVGPEIRNRKEAFWAALHVMRQDQPLFLVVGGIAFFAMAADLALKGLSIILLGIGLL